MTMNVIGYAAQSPTAELAPHRFERRDPRPDDVVIDILYCGVCHSALHTARNDWGWTTYRLAAEPKELHIVPGAGHVDLYDRVNLIPWDKLISLFKKHLA